MSYPYGPSGVITAARVDLYASTNTTFEDAYQFDPPSNWAGVTGPTWGFTGNWFQMDVKGNRGQTGPLLSVKGPTGNSQMIQVQDPTNRILNFNIPAAVLTGLTGATGATGPGLVPGKYIYDFLMVQPGLGQADIVVMLMQGVFILYDGITIPGD
jgi:hypothetical protein